MKYLQFTIVVFISLACYVGFGVSMMQCYQCNSFMDKQCADHFSKADKYLLNCPTNTTMCRKIVQDVYYEGDWHTRYIRECARAGQASTDCTDRTGTYKLKIKYCQCGEPECNGAANIQLNIVAVLLPLITVLITVFRKL